MGGPISVASHHPGYAVLQSDSSDPTETPDALLRDTERLPYVQEG